MAGGTLRASYAGVHTESVGRSEIRCCVWCGKERKVKVARYEHAYTCYLCKPYERFAAAQNELKGRAT